MKRGWIGFGLLALLLTGGLLVTWRMDRCHSAISKDLEQAVQYAIDEDWQMAAALTDKAHSDWDSAWGFSAAFADHGPMEEINGLFAELKVYEKIRKETDFAATCAELAEKISAMGDAHGLMWWNLL